MESAIDYAKTQKRNGHIALGITLAVTLGTAVFIYLSSVGVFKNGGILFIFGLAVTALLFGISTALFYSRYKSIHHILENPLVHWQYSSDKDDWLPEGTAEAIISEHGIYYSPANDKLHTFWSVSSKLEALKMGRLPDYDCPTMNFFFVKAKTYDGNTISAALHVPVPKGQEEIAEKLLEQLSQNLELNRVKRIKLLAGIVVTFIAFFAILAIIIRTLGL